MSPSYNGLLTVNHVHSYVNEMNDCLYKRHVIDKVGTWTLVVGLVSSVAMMIFSSYSKMLGVIGVSLFALSIVGGVVLHYTLENLIRRFRIHEQTLGLHASKTDYPKTTLKIQAFNANDKPVICEVVYEENKDIGLLEWKLVSLNNSK